MSFSERYGFKTVKEVVQRESMDNDLRVGLWNVLDAWLWSRGRKAKWLKDAPGLHAVTRALWHSYFKLPLDDLSDWWPDIQPQFRSYFFSCAWNEVYDFLEFIVTNNPYRDDADAIAKASNGILERELSAYRLVGKRVVEITSPEEIASIEDALAGTASTPTVQTHLRAALEHLADRESPDYRNSIKESISAVEAMVNRAAGTSGKTLGVALAKLNIQTHPALDGAFSKLYGYTNDSSGIRHALMDEPNLEFEDAKFMLVACSAFVNYVLAKAGRAGISV